ncbi:exodeoxyribonuclease V subunit alpha [Pseudoduganella sp. DS3]|uniref:RecBCD enzyme subunit RecD n=1 Tax=Pseudoduganella guangdongensis TaxID=2692179 RepID=A0A6N9HIH1_9BURK|nr:exodeoxyribonuclease V subunit alpha [Pseudoduganella guangdongensis]MYN03364.1 exodeoxyribonuclease V subunit alpha [Pseudoduganella guangdongensis]
MSFYEHIDMLAEGGMLRRLGPVFARFVTSLAAQGSDAAGTPLALACLLLSELEGRGHSCLQLAALADDPSPMLGWSDDDWPALCAEAGALPQGAAAWQAYLQACPQVLSWPGGADHGQPLVLAGGRLYLRRYWSDENTVADAVRGRTGAGSAGPAPALLRQWLDRLFTHATREGGVDWQKIACAVAARGGLAVITGGPGTGKTYTVARLLALLFAVEGEQAGNLRVALAAPTGKAAARLKQAIDDALEKLEVGLDGALPLRALAERMGGARTLHSLLGARPDTRAFRHNAANPLDVDVLIVDEASMVHLEMMAALLEALPPTARLILLGDKDQLASVEAGSVLGDLCHDAQAGGYDAATAAFVQAATGQDIGPEYLGHAGALAQQTVMLRQSRRFGGPIGQLALAVNQGDAEAARAVLRADSAGQLHWNEAAQQEDMLRLAAEGYRPFLQLVQQGSGGHEHDAWAAGVLQAFESFRLLCAVREGEWGVTGLNDSIAQRLESLGLLKRRGEWYVGRPVMVTRNDYATGVYNGDIGLVLPDPERAGSLRVYFSDAGKVRSVLATRLRNVDTAFAMTVHKSQGSEFSHTVLVLPREASSVLARELVYTGITRARQRFTLLTPNPGVLPDAIRRRTERTSGLHSLLA